MNCLNCGAELQPVRPRGRAKQYCSPRCRANAHYRNGQVATALLGGAGRVLQEAPEAVREFMRYVSLGTTPADKQARIRALIEFMNLAGLDPDELTRALASTWEKLLVVNS